MRILHVTSRLVSGGAARNLLNVIDWERRQGHQVSIAVGVDHEPGLCPPGAAMSVLPSLVREVNPAADIRALRELRRVVAGHSYDIVHTHLAKGGILGRMAARGQTRVLVHTIHGVSFGRSFGHGPSLAYLAAERLCGGFTDRFVAVGQEVKQGYLRAGIGTEEKYFIIRSPLDVETFLAARTLPPWERTSLRFRFGVEEGMRVIAAAGRLARGKRYALLLHAAAPLLRDRMARLMLAGEGPQRRELELLAAQLGVSRQVQFLGHTAELAQLLAVSDVFAHTSAAEGVPQVVLQALAAGVAVVATDVEGLREIEPAPITIVPRTGAGLTNAIALLLAPGERTSLPAEAFSPWTTDAIEQQIAAFHESLKRRPAFPSQRGERTGWIPGSRSLR